ncbi:unnamed protein product [Hydatigera taeniaeformis]|uniref:Secreted RxLR effector peptide protein n=1 Tax=Hydatigena taeniaeformis TaxID=6205 RepID=A0A0R3WLK4_HYDTA|nr:unnamed protein product [Hydatigera taeniaeformis]
MIRFALRFSILLGISSGVDTYPRLDDLDARKEAVVDRRMLINTWKGTLLHTVEVDIHDLANLDDNAQTYFFSYRRGNASNPVKMQMQKL